MGKAYQIGPWVFDAALGLLTREAEEERLENRASRLLHLFCSAGGRLIQHDEIIEKIWNGRTTSSNSVAVVVADLRRALGDSAKSPTFIETVPKRGYRLLVTPQPLDKPLATGTQITGTAWITKPWALMLFALFALLLVTFAILNRTPAPQDMIAVTPAPVENLTGSTEYDALQAAVSELIPVELMRHSQVRIAPEADAPIRLSASLIIWDGQPAVSLSAENAAGEAVWSGMASGPEQKLPGQIRREIRDFVTALPDTD